MSDGKEKSKQEVGKQQQGGGVLLSVLVPVCLAAAVRCSGTVSRAFWLLTWVLIWCNGV